MVIGKVARKGIYQGINTEGIAELGHALLNLNELKSLVQSSE